MLNVLLTVWKLYSSWKYNFYWAIAQSVEKISSGQSVWYFLLRQLSITVYFRVFFLPSRLIFSVFLFLPGLMKTPCHLLKVSVMAEIPFTVLYWSTSNQKVLCQQQSASDIMFLIFCLNRGVQKAMIEGIFSWRKMTLTVAISQTIGIG